MTCETCWKRPAIAALPAYGLVCEECDPTNKCGPERQLAQERLARVNFYYKEEYEG